MAKVKSNISPSANTATKRVAPTITQLSSDLSAASTQTIFELKRNLLVQELVSSLTSISLPPGHMDFIDFQNSLSSLLLTWPDTALKKYRELLRRTIMAIESPNFSVKAKALAKNTWKHGSAMSTHPTKWSSQGEEYSYRPRITIDSSKKATRRSSRKSKKRAKMRKKL